MQSKKAASPKPTKYVHVAVRFTPDELKLIKEAAANRGLGFNLYLRLVCAGTSKLVLRKAPREELVGRFLDADSVLRPGRQPSESA